MLRRPPYVSHINWCTQRFIACSLKISNSTRPSTSCPHSESHRHFFCRVLLGNIFLHEFLISRNSLEVTTRPRIVWDRCLVTHIQTARCNDQVLCSVADWPRIHPPSSSAISVVYDEFSKHWIFLLVFSRRTNRAWLQLFLTLEDSVANRVAENIPFWKRVQVRETVLDEKIAFRP